MNDAAQLLKWSQQLGSVQHGRECCMMLLEAVAHQRLTLTALHAAHILVPLCAALQSKDPAVQHRAVAVLLEASRCGPGGEVQLCSVAGCCQALLDVVAAAMPTALDGSVFDPDGHEQPLQPTKETPNTKQQLQQLGSSIGGHEVLNAKAIQRDAGPGGQSKQVVLGRASGAVAQEGTTSVGEAAGGPGRGLTDGSGSGAGGAAREACEDPAEAARGACLLLWRLSGEVEARELMMAGTSALVPVLMVLLGTPSAVLRMAASGTLQQLSAAPRVQLQLVGSAQELLPVLVGLLARVGIDQLLAAAAHAASVPHAPITPGTAAAVPAGGLRPEGSRSRVRLDADPPTPRTPLAGQDSPNPFARGMPLPAPSAKSISPSAGAGGSPDGATETSGGLKGPPGLPGTPRQVQGQVGQQQQQLAAGHAEALASTLVHVAGLLRVLCCHVEVAAAMVAGDGQPLRRLLRALAQVGCVLQHINTQQQWQQSARPLVAQASRKQVQPQAAQQDEALAEKLAQFAALGGGAVAALLGHAPGQSLGQGSPGGGAPPGAGASVPGVSGSLGIAPGAMAVLHQHLRESDTASQVALASNSGVCGALALALQLGVRAVGADVALPFPHPHAYPQTRAGANSAPVSGLAAAAGVRESQAGAVQQQQQQSGTPRAAHSAAADGRRTPGADTSATAVPQGEASHAAAAAGPMTLASASAALRAAACALHALRLLAAAPDGAAADALAAGECGAASCMRLLVYQPLQQSAPYMHGLYEQVIAVQAIACGTLARLSSHPGLRALPHAQEALAPPAQLLSALASLLLLPQSSASSKGNSSGGAGAPSASAPVVAVPLATRRCYVASLLAAAAEYGPYSYDAFTQVLVAVRGALGVIISLLPQSSTPGSAKSASTHPASLDSSNVASGLPPTPSPSATGAMSTASAASTARALPAVSAPGPRPGGPQAGGGGSVPGGGDPLDDAAAAGVDAALDLCHVAAHSRDVARVLAGKTTLVPTLLTVLRDRRPAPVPFPTGPASPTNLRVKSIRLLRTLTDKLDESAVHSELVADPGLASALLLALGPQQQPPVAEAALGWLAQLLGQPAFVAERLQGSTVTELLGRLLELLQLLPPQGATAAGTLTPSRAASLAALNAAAAAAGTAPGGGGGSPGTPSGQRGASSGGGLNSSLRGAGARAAAASGGNAGGAGGSLNSSLRSGANSVPTTTQTTGGGGGGGSGPAAVDLPATSPAVAAAAATALRRLANASPVARTQLCSVPGLVPAIIRQTSSLLDSVTAWGYVLPEVTGTHLSELLALLAALCYPPGAPDQEHHRSSHLNSALQALNRRSSFMAASCSFSAVGSSSSSSHGRHRVQRTSSALSDAPSLAAGLGGGGGADRDRTSSGDGGGARPELGEAAASIAAGAAAAAAKAGPAGVAEGEAAQRGAATQSRAGPAAGQTANPPPPPAAAAVPGAGAGGKDLLRQLLDTPSALQVLCEVLDVVAAVQQAARRQGRLSQGGGSRVGPEGPASGATSRRGGASGSQLVSPSTAGGAASLPGAGSLASPLQPGSSSQVYWGSGMGDGAEALNWASRTSGTSAATAVLCGSPSRRLRAPESPMSRLGLPPAELGGADSDHMPSPARGVWWAPGGHGTSPSAGLAALSVPPGDRAGPQLLRSIRSWALDSLSHAISRWCETEWGEEGGEALAAELQGLAVELAAMGLAASPAAGGGEGVLSARPSGLVAPTGASDVAPPAVSVPHEYDPRRQPLPLPVATPASARAASANGAPRRGRLATVVPPPLPPPLPPALGEVVMISTGGRGPAAPSGEGASTTTIGPSGQVHSVLLRRVVRVCCELMTPEEAPALRAAAAGVVSAVVSLADELAGVLAATVPQLTDRLMDLLGLMGSGGALAAAADGAATADGASAFASVAMFAVMRGGGGGGGGARQRADTGGGDGDGDAALGVDGSEGVAALQQRLQHDAEACVLAMEVLMQLAQNPWAQALLANHPRLAGALDGLMDEDAAVTLKALLEGMAGGGGGGPVSGPAHAGDAGGASLRSSLEAGQGPGLGLAHGGKRGSDGQATHPHGGGGGGAYEPKHLPHAHSLASSSSFTAATASGAAPASPPLPIGPPDVRQMAPELIAALAPHARRPLIPAPGAGKGSLISALDVALRERRGRAQAVALQALWALCASPGGAAAVAASAVPRTLVALMRGGAQAQAQPQQQHHAGAHHQSHHQHGLMYGQGHVHGQQQQVQGLHSAGPGSPDYVNRVQALGVLSSLVERLDGAAAASLAAVEGLAAALLDQVLAAGETLMRCGAVKTSGGGTSGSGGAASTHGPRTGGGGGGGGGSGGGSMGMSSGELPDVGTLQVVHHQLLWGVAAVAALSRSAAVAARFASLKGLPPALLAALKVRTLDVQLYGAGLLGNLAGHSASAAVVAGVRGAARELVRMLRDCGAEPHSEYTLPLLAAIRNLAATERGRQELASDPTTVPSLVRGLAASAAGLAAAATAGGMGVAADVSQLQSMQLLCVAVLANLSADRCGLEALVADHALLLPPLWALARGLVAQAPGGGGGEWRLARVDSRLRLLVCVVLANAMGHPVLAKTSLTLHDALPVLVSLVLALPGPARHAAQADPLAPLRRRRPRLAAVAAVEALKQLLVAAGPRALHSLKGRPVKAGATPSAAAVAASAAASSTTTEPRSPAAGPTPPSSVFAAAAAAAAVAAGTGSLAAPPAPAPGAPGSPARLAHLVDHVMDLLSWVDFHSANEVTGDPGNAGMGADLAGAAAGVVCQLAVLGVLGRFPEYADGSCQSLVKLLLLPTLLPAAPAPLQLHGLGAGLGLGLGGGTRGGAGGGAPGGGAGALVAGGGAPPGALEVAAGHAAAALWALTSNPQCRAWAQQVRSDPAAHQVLLLTVRRGTRGGTRARFSAARIFAAVTLGQLAVQGAISPSAFPHTELVSPANGLPGALLDLLPLALPSAHGGGGSGGGAAVGGGPGQQHGGRGAGRGGGGGPVGAFERHPGAEARGGGGAGGVSRRERVKDVDPQELARSSALALVGTTPDMRATLGLQAAGSLARLAGEPGGAAALVSLPGLLEGGVALLGCGQQEAAVVCCALLSTLSSAGGWAACRAMGRCPGLVEALGAALGSGSIQVRAYCAVALGNMALGPPQPPPQPPGPDGTDSHDAAAATAQSPEEADAAALLERLVSRRSVGGEAESARSGGAGGSGAGDAPDGEGASPLDSLRRMLCECARLLDLQLRHGSRARERTSTGAGRGGPAGGQSLGAGPVAEGTRREGQAGAQRGEPEPQALASQQQDAAGSSGRRDITHPDTVDAVPGVGWYLGRNRSRGAGSGAQRAKGPAAVGPAAASSGAAGPGSPRHLEGQQDGVVEEPTPPGAAAGAGASSAACREREGEEEVRCTAAAGGSESSSLASTAPPAAAHASSSPRASAQQPDQYQPQPQQQQQMLQSHPSALLVSSLVTPIATPQVAPLAVVVASSSGGASGPPSPSRSPVPGQAAAAGARGITRSRSRFGPAAAVEAATAAAAVPAGPGPSSSPTEPEAADIGSISLGSAPTQPRTDQLQHHPTDSVLRSSEGLTAGANGITTAAPAAAGAPPAVSWQQLLPSVSAAAAAAGALQNITAASAAACALLLYDHPPGDNDNVRSPGASQEGCNGSEVHACVGSSPRAGRGRPGSCCDFLPACVSLLHSCQQLLGGSSRLELPDALPSEPQGEQGPGAEEGNPAAGGGEAAGEGSPTLILLRLALLLLGTLANLTATPHGKRALLQVLVSGGEGWEGNGDGDVSCSFRGRAVSGGGSQHPGEGEEDSLAECLVALLTLPAPEELLQQEAGGGPAAAAGHGKGNAQAASPKVGLLRKSRSDSLRRLASQGYGGPAGEGGGGALGAKEEAEAEAHEALRQAALGLCVNLVLVEEAQGGRGQGAVPDKEASFWDEAMALEAELEGGGRSAAGKARVGAAGEAAGPGSGSGVSGAAGCVVSQSPAVAAPEEMRYGSIVFRSGSYGLVGLGGGLGAGVDVDEDLLAMELQSVMAWPVGAGAAEGVEGEGGAGDAGVGERGLRGGDAAGGLPEQRDADGAQGREVLLALLRESKGAREYLRGLSEARVKELRPMRHMAAWLLHVCEGEDVGEVEMLGGAAG